MAETLLSLSFSDLTSVKWKDYTSPTPLEYSPNYSDAEGGGTLAWTEHRAESVESQNARGAALSFRDGALTGRSEITITNVTVRDLGKHASDVALMDVLQQTGTVGSAWVSATGTGADGSRVIPAVDEGEQKRFKFEIVVANRGASGAVKGHTVTWDDVEVVPGYSISWQNGKCLIESLTLRSSQMAPFKARTT